MYKLDPDPMLCVALVAINVSLKTDRSKFGGTAVKSLIIESSV